MYSAGILYLTDYNNSDMTKIRANWAEDLASALDALKSGCSQRVVAKRFKIPRRTLRNHLQSGKFPKNWEEIQC